MLVALIVILLKNNRKWATAQLQNEAALSNGHAVNR
jgi:hypothetical protein